ncbi:MAG: 4Fe-4S ferredoxin iron-sulfur binding domain-containing protein [Parcubacteria group bacterium GW2011_GWC2_39_14]|nr:MAG: 4Fe-4S ferredoxin iron-sulfur binding domain-containing protein [Parcubacteria group bacterium GW2011_GWC2_39_14]KKR54622.1 MAG: 4Fe-4S ferredoxin iron-sulfur binding domain-containing protein [Parcubacteria group bacterium GW2011_GWA2_40_23]
MNKTFFSESYNEIPNEVIAKMDSIFSGGNKVLVKLHFGEPGNPYALMPKDIESIVDYFKKKNIEVTLFDTPVAYNSPRKTVAGYEKVAKDRGYNQLANVLISDDYKEIATKNMIVQVAKPLVESEMILVISHVKGHYCAGFGGAIKNLAMGGVTPKSKSDQHGLGAPKWIAECQGCGLCTSFCPAKTIKMENGKANINLKGCWGCSICELNCPHNCLAPQVAYFDDLLGQSAAAVINNLPSKTFYINIVKNISKFCDCEANPEEIIAPDLGVLFCSDAVQIDRATLDLINQKTGENTFLSANHKDPYLQIDYTQKYIV